MMALRIDVQSNTAEDLKKKLEAVAKDLTGRDGVGASGQEMPAAAALFHKAAIQRVEWSSFAQERLAGTDKYAGIEIDSTEGIVVGKFSETYWPTAEHHNKFLFPLTCNRSDCDVSKSASYLEFHYNPRAVSEVSHAHALIPAPNYFLSTFNNPYLNGVRPTALTPLTYSKFSTFFSSPFWQWHPACVGGYSADGLTLETDVSKQLHVRTGAVLRVVGKDKKVDDSLWLVVCTILRLSRTTSTE